LLMKHSSPLASALSAPISQINVSDAPTFKAGRCGVCNLVTMTYNIKAKP
jgi:hypothetical protein